MKKSRNSSAGLSVSPSLSSVVAFLAIAGAFAFIFYWTENRIHQVHRDLFNAEAPLTYNVDFENLEIVATTRISSVPRTDSKFKELPFMSQPQVFRVTHRIGFGSHKGIIEIKVSDNSQEAEYLSSDITINFNAGFSEVSVSAPSFKYEAPEFTLVFGEINGSISQSGPIRFKVSSLDIKMVNYNFKLTDLSINVPRDQKAINLLASKIQFDDVSLDHSKVNFMGMNPFEINLISTFNTQPLEAHWSIQKTTILNQDVKVGSGKMKFPVSLLDAFIDPKIDRQLLADEKDAKNTGSEKVRFLFSAAKDVKRSEAKATTLRALTSSKNIKREGDFYYIRVDKQDAFKLLEEKTQKAAERKSYIDSWTALSKDKMLEEAFYAVIFGDNNRALAVKEFIQLKEPELKADPLFLALKTRSDMREKKDVTEKVSELVPLLSDHKFATLLRFALAKTWGEKPLVMQLHEELKKKEQEPQILAMFEYLKNLQVDNSKALQSLELAREMNPKSLYVQNFLRNRIYLYQQMNEKEKMEADLKVLMESNPEPEDILAYSSLLQEKKDLTNALLVIEKCIEQNPVHKECNEQRESVMTLIAYDKLKENEGDALQYLQNLLVDRPASVSANKGVGYIYKLKKDVDKSINHYSIACALGGAAACIDGGDYLAEQGANERAILLYDISCDLKSGSGCFKAGLLFEKSKDLERSGEYFERSCNQFQDNVGCYHLARNLQKKQAPNKAIAPYLSKACKLYDSACKLATVYQTTNKQPDIPDEPE